MPDIAAAAKQTLRMRRFLMSVMTYLACSLIAQVCAWLGFLPSRWPTYWTLGALAVLGVFFTVFHKGWNLRLKDPSMTEIQITTAMFAAMALLSQADEARGALLLFVPVPMLFGILRLNFRQMARVGALALLGYVAVIAMTNILHPGRVRFALEALHLIALGSIILYMCIMCAYISKVRDNLAIAVRTIREQADRDSLTGLFNRRNFMERLDVEVARCQRRVAHGVTLGIIDLDNFKQINDRFGHPVGDEVLIEVGMCLREAIRRTDYVCRFGGEEFAVLLNGDSREEALATCERIRTRIEQLRLPLLGDLTISTSIGVAYFNVGEKPAGLIGRADQALYRAKAEGRNRVCWADDYGAPAQPATQPLEWNERVALDQ